MTRKQEEEAERRGREAAESGQANPYHSGRGRESITFEDARQEELRRRGQQDRPTNNPYY